MARTKTDTRDRTVEQLVDVFFLHGFDGTSLSLISAATGMQRASLYHHFPGGKEEMARAVIEHAAQWTEKFVLQLVRDASQAPVEKITQIMHNLDGLHWRSAQLSPSNAFGIGEACEPFSGQIRQSYLDCVDVLVELMVACGISPQVAKRRAWEQRILWEGALVCSRILNDLTLFRATMQRMPMYLLAPNEVPGFFANDVQLPTGRVGVANEGKSQELTGGKSDPP